MKLGDLEFKAIDFQGIYAAVGIRLGTDLTPLADHVNRLLKERLEKAPEVVAWQARTMISNWWTKTWHYSHRDKEDLPTHRARLVCIESLPTDKELHDAAKCL